MSDAPYPKVEIPPRRVQVDRKWWSRSLLGRRTTLVPSSVVLMVVVGGASGSNRRIRWTMDASRRTGHITGSRVRWWVRLSSLDPFF